MWTFNDIINFKYDNDAVDSDIKHLLKTGEFKPAYADLVRKFLIPEIVHCKKTIDDDNHLLWVRLQGPMSEDNLIWRPAEINPILDWLGFTAEKRSFWFNYYVHPQHGRQKAPPLSILQNGAKKVIITPFGLTNDAFQSVYTEIHELMHGVQGKFFQPGHRTKFYEDHYNLLFQGKSQDESIAIQTADHPELIRDLYCERCFMEMQANAAATCYMMLQAQRSEDESIVFCVEQRLLNESASMSEALMNENLGLTYFEYPSTKKIIEEIKQGKCSYLLNSQGLLNWKKLYDYTKNKVEEMGYSKEDMFASLQMAKLLKKIKCEHKESKEDFLNTVLNEAKNLPHPHNKIFNQFVEAQQNFFFDTSKNLNQFYHRLGVENDRARILEMATAQIIPHIEEYRDLYFQTQNNKKNFQANVFQDLKKGRGS